MLRTIELFNDLCFSLTALVSTDVSFGTWHAIGWITSALHGGRVSGGYGIFHLIRTVIYYLYCVNVFPCTMRSADVQ